MLGVAMEGYREKAYGLIVNGWKDGETAAVHAIVLKYSDDRHDEFLFGPDELYLSVTFGNSRRPPDEEFAIFTLTLEKILKGYGFGHVTVQYQPVQLI
jgi:hypothetical protein